MKTLLLTITFLLSFAAAAHAADSNIKTTAFPMTAVATAAVQEYSVSKDIYGIGVKNGTMVPAQLADLNLKKFSCYLIMVQGTSYFNPAFFEEGANGKELKAGTKLFAKGFYFGNYSSVANYPSPNYESVTSSQIDIYFQIVDGKNQSNPEGYDLVVSCPAYASTDIKSLIDNTWNADMTDIIARVNKRLAGVLQISAGN